MKKEKDHAGVYLPPPIIYAAIFFIALLLQRLLPVSMAFFEKDALSLTGIIFFLLGIYIGMRGVGRFIKTGNTIVTMKPSSSLQEKGMYQFTRNPMYVGMISGYLGFTCFFGNWWHIILLPVLIVIIQEYVIKREERYLQRKFGEDYKNYRKKVRRWV